MYRIKPLRRQKSLWLEISFFLWTIRNTYFRIVFLPLHPILLTATAFFFFITERQQLFFFVTQKILILYNVPTLSLSSWLLEWSFPAERNRCNETINVAQTAPHREVSRYWLTIMASSYDPILSLGSRSIRRLEHQWRATNAPHMASTISTSNDTI